MTMFPQYVYKLLWPSKATVDSGVEEQSLDEESGDGNRVSSVGDTRSVWIGGAPATGERIKYPDNRVISAKYSPWNFLPKNLFEQFRRIANFYFLCIAIISLSIESPVSPLTSILPLVFVIVVTMVKQGYEDWLRHCADREVNGALVTVIRNGCAQKVKAKLLCVGDLIRIENDSDIPCDMVLLSSSQKDGKCFVTTANLDGETNLKTLLCPKLLRYFSQPEQLATLHALIECEQPTPDLYKFYGKIEVFPDEAVQLNGEIPLGRTSLMTIKSSDSDQDSNLLRSSSSRVNGDVPIGRNSVVSFRASQISTDAPVNRNSVIKVNSDASIRTSSLSFRTCHMAEDSVSRDSTSLRNGLKRNSSATQFEECDNAGSSKRVTMRRNSVQSISSVRRHSVSLSAPLGPENILLRGTRLKNTDYIYGCAVYTGQETKLALNSKLTSNKFSTVERSINGFLLFFLVLLLLEVFLCLGLKYGFELVGDYVADYYVGPLPQLNGLQVVEDMFSFFVLFNYIIPISLYVTIELQKFLGSLFFGWDLELYCEETKQGAICNTSDLNEELGQVEYLFTDKTGTLTENDMQFRRCSIGGVAYVENNGELFRLTEDGTERNSILLQCMTPEIEHFLIALALCHSVQITSGNNGVNNNDQVEMDSKLDYQASSPDEKALVSASARCGVVFLGEEGDINTIQIRGKIRRYKKLDCLEFTSDRKRMSVIVEDEDGFIWLFCKGAESAVIPLADDGPKQETQRHITDFAMRGLRTMIVGCRKMDVVQYNTLKAQIELSRQTLSTRRESVVAKSYTQMERGLILLGATGVEDRLQDGVQETLESLRAAGIKVWILTGDKVETAVNISYSCGHFKAGTMQLSLTEQRSDESCQATLALFRAQIYAERHKQFGLVVDGVSLRYALRHPETFREICTACTAVICCRMSPLQKCEVVQLMKYSPMKPVTAAIGDGANDVSMIQEAHVGIGIVGKEGRQAVRCSDFAFARFRFLRRTLLVHGHWYYERISTLVLYFFYKNIFFITPQVFFQFHCLYSTQALYDSLYLTIFNVICTSLPILIYGIFEQTRPSTKLIAYPHYYKEISRNVYMTWSTFFQWTCLGIWHSVVAYFLPWLLLASNPVLLYDSSPVDFAGFGTIIFHNVMVVCNLKLWLHSHYWTSLFIGSLLLSIFGTIFVVLIYNFIFWSILGYNLFWVYNMLLASPSFWLISVLTTVVCLIPDVTFPLLLGKINSYFRKLSERSQTAMQYFNPRRKRTNLNDTVVTRC
ncbi:phospholipid-transporting ATPase IF-like isoform X1 [Schistocerca serialis cubense]|uniref:phospholipid-transporting ATPase IF-like isoform X1 n=2 Tax=Schistocerca serialis cubense TaxID=2023355 RepID=UPI00214E85D9|nr:phospholipid-transporting ATPase IF-like isoform X1 [Schistocerca serialis cubense]